MQDKYEACGVNTEGGDARSLAAVCVELSGADVADIYSPQRFTAMAPKFGLVPGCAVDMCEPKMDGPHEGECWDLDRKRDVTELDRKIVEQEPELLTGSPPCDPFSAPQMIMRKSRRRPIIWSEDDATSIRQSGSTASRWRRAGIMARQQSLLSTIRSATAPSG